MEFYRALYKLTNGSVLPTPEFGTAAKGGGMVDFLIPARVELTRDSVGISEHCSRFEDRGYAGRVTSGVVIDRVALDPWIGIPTCAAREGRGYSRPHRGGRRLIRCVDVRNFFYIYFIDGFREVRILDSRLTPMEQFGLLEM